MRTDHIVAIGIKVPEKLAVRAQLKLLALANLIREVIIGRDYLGISPVCDLDGMLTRIVDAAYPTIGDPFT